MYTLIIGITVLILLLGYFLGLYHIINLNFDNISIMILVYTVLFIFISLLGLNYYLK